MSFFGTLNSYRQNYRISPGSYFILALHYPIFKIAWVSEYGQGIKKKVSKLLMPLLGNYKIFTTLPIGARNLKLVISLKSDSLSSFKEIFWGGEYEMKDKITEIKTVVDLGANTGMASMYFLSRFRPDRLLCVEGNTTLVPHLKEIQSQLDGQCDVMIENVCVTGNHNGVITFVINPNHRDSHVVFGSDERGIQCPGLSLRSILEKHHFQDVDLLKIDIEGGEYDILKKDPQIFRRFKHILIEVHGDDQTRESFRGGIKAQGFELLQIKPSGGFDCEISHFRRL